MMEKLRTIEHRFVDIIPDELEHGVLYISTAYATAMHKCACGCGQRVVTPIRPAGWTLLWDGRSATLDPSIGNWSLPCRSHYFVRQGRIVWARQGRKTERRAGEKRREGTVVVGRFGWWGGVLRRGFRRA